MGERKDEMDVCPPELFLFKVRGYFRERETNEASRLDV